MTDYMYNNGQQEQDKFADTPFNRIDEIGFLSGDRLETAIQEATKIERAVTQRGTIATDERVIESLALPTEFTNAKSWYATVVAPIAQTSPDIAWRSAYTLDIEQAPEPDSEGFREAASELNIPNTKPMKYVPDFIRSAYRVLYNHVDEYDRPIHPYTLESEANAILTDRGYKQAHRYLGDLPGIEPPASDGPAWAQIDPEQEATTVKGETHV